nr:hypothetical protein [Tanacetum cinerariifolium]
MVRKFRIQCYNCKDFGHVARECQKLKRAKDAAYHREKMLLWIQSTQEKFKFMAAADASKETERVKANCILENNLQQASTLGTQSDKAPIYDSDKSVETPIQHPQPNNNFVEQPSFNMNYMQQQMQNLEDILDPTTAIDMTLVLVAKTFTLNNTTPKNNNQMSSTNSSNMQIAQPGMNINQDRQMLMDEDNVGNQFRTNAVQNVRNQSDKAPIYDSDKSVEVHLSKTCYDNDIKNMFTQEEQYTELLEFIPEPHQVPQNDSNVIYEVFNMEQVGGIVEQHPANVEETRVSYDTLY